MSLAELLTMALRYEGWDVRSAGDGFSAVRTAREFGPDLVVLDIMLPDIDGLEVLRRLRAGAPTLPVLFLTAKDAVEDRIAGLTVGGDDYVTKPFSLEGVMARLRALLRRSGMTVARTPAVVVGDLILDEDSREVCRDGDIVELTATEFELLRYLMRNPRRVLSKAQILVKKTRGAALEAAAVRVGCHGNGRRRGIPRAHLLARGGGAADHGCERGTRDAGVASYRPRDGRPARQRRLHHAPRGQVARLHR